MPQSTFGVFSPSNLSYSGVSKLVILMCICLNTNAINGGFTWPLPFYGFIKLYYIFWRPFLRYRYNTFSSFLLSIAF